MRCKTIQEAREQAQANANLTGVPWVVFFDASLNPRCERYTTQKIDGMEIINPSEDE